MTMTGTSGACRESASRDHVAVAAEQHHAPQPVADRDHEVVEAGALGQPAGDPHHGVVGLQRGLGGVRVGGLGVVDPGDAVDLGDRGDPVAVGAEGAQPVAHRGLGDAVGAGQRGGGQGVGDDVRAPGEARSAIVHSSAALVSRCSMNARSTRMSSTTPSMPDAGHAEGEPDRAGALLDVGLAHQPLGLGVGHVVDAGPLHPLVDAALVGGVVGHARRAGVPVEVVLGDVEHRGGLGAHRVGVVQLEAGQLDGEDVVRLGVHHRLDDRQADVADGDAAQPRGAQDRVEHLHGRGLAVGAGDAQPRASAWSRVAQPPGQLDLAPDRDAAGAGLRQQRGGRAASPARSPATSTSSGSVAVAPAPEPDVGAEHLEQLGLLGRRRPSPVSSSATTRGAEVGEVVGGGEAGHAEARPPPRGPPAQASWRPSVSTSGRFMRPATHSA